MSFHKSDRAEYIRSGNKLREETLKSLAEYFQSIHDARVSNGSLQRKRDKQICQSTRREMRQELEQGYHKKMRCYMHSRDKRQHTYDERGHDKNSNQVGSSHGRYKHRRPKKDSRGDRKSSSTQNDRDFKPCHVHGAESKHTYNECQQNPKNTGATNKSSYYVKRRSHDTHYHDSCRLSSDDESPSEHGTPAPSDGEVSATLSIGSRSATNFHVDTSYHIPKRRRLVKATDVGHKSPEHKTLVEPDLGMTEKCPKENTSPGKFRSSNSDGDLTVGRMSIYDDDVINDDVTACYQEFGGDKYGLSIHDKETDDAFGFAN
jgi:hypothetical protein